MFILSDAGRHELYCHLACVLIWKLLSESVMEFYD